MPRATQIVPQYKFPYVETYYNDNTGIVDVEPTTVIDGFRTLCVFASGRGRDNVIVTKNTADSFDAEYGVLDFKHYGQAMLNARAFLESGNAIVHCMRVMPSDANKANAVAYAKVKIEKGAPSGGSIVEIPKGLKGSIVEGSPTTNTISWTASATPTDTYEMIINGDTSNIIAVTGITYVHNDLVTGNTVTYQVRTVTSTGTVSEWTNVLTMVCGTIGEITTTDKPTPTTVPTGLTIKFFMSAQDAVKTEDDLSTYMEELSKADADVDGFVTVPLFAVTSAGRGVYGNNFRVRVVTDTVETKDTDVVHHYMEIYDTSVSSSSAQERYSFSLNPEVIIDDETHYIADVIGDADGGSKLVNAVGFEDGLSTIYNMYLQVHPDTDVDIDNFNIFLGQTNAGVVIPNFTVYTPLATDEAITYSRLDGCGLGYGSDGSCAVTNPELADIIQKEYTKAFNGDIFNGIKSKRAYPVDVLVDANYDNAAKVALSNLCSKRTDCQLILDAGIVSTVAEALTWANQTAIKAIDDMHQYKIFQNSVVKDPATQRRIAVTDSYFYAKLLPYHYYVLGRNLAMTGEEYGLVEGIVAGKHYPSIEYDDTTLKAQLYDARLNYVENIRQNVYVIGTQSSSQSSNSDLLEMNNVAILLFFKKKLEDIAVNATYRFAEAEDRKKYTKSAEAVLGEFTSWVRSFEVKFDMNAYEEKRSILHCYLSVVFKTMSKSCIIEIDINPRA